MKKILLFAILISSSICFSQSPKTYKLKQSQDVINEYGKPDIEIYQNGVLKIFIEKGKIVFKGNSANEKIYDLYENEILGRINLTDFKIIDVNQKGFPEIQFKTRENNGMGNWASTSEYTIIIDIENASVLWNSLSYHFTEKYQDNWSDEWHQDITFTSDKIRVTTIKGNPFSENPKGIKVGTYRYSNGNFIREY